MLSVPLGIVVALALAVLLNLRVRGQSIYRVIFFLPSIIPLVASAVVWSYVFDPQFGILNNALSKVGITGPGWLADPSWSKPALIIFGSWGVGNLMIIMLAGLQDVPEELHQQAMMDRAGPAARFRHVTLPFLGPHLLFALVTGLIAGFQYFTPAYVLTGGTGGPAGSTLFSGSTCIRTPSSSSGSATRVRWRGCSSSSSRRSRCVVFRFVGRRIYYGGE